ncbi:MAG: hypothetical protein GF334_06880 [Candidatus Altiarchaeales archaeon]|nr:hypothetical protein [Candidatus Altiarchaeales archaeon]
MGSDIFLEGTLIKETVCIHGEVINILIELTRGESPQQIKDLVIASEKTLTENDWTFNRCCLPETDTYIEVRGIVPWEELPLYVHWDYLTPRFQELLKNG